MSLIRRMLGPAGEWRFEDDTVSVDIGFIVRALILFDKFIINSTRLKEIPSLVSRLGYDDTLELLKSGCLRVYCSSFTVAQIGQTDIGKRHSRGILPIGSYSFGMPRAHDNQAYMNRCLQGLSMIPGLSQKQVIRLEGSLSKVLDVPSEDFGRATLRQLESDIGSGIPTIKPLVARVLRDELKVEADPSAVELKVDQISERDFRVDTNIPRLCGLSADQVHKVVERALLALGGFNQTIEEMRACNALSGFNEEEIPLFAGKLDFLLAAVNPDAQQRRMMRVLSLAGLTDEGPEGIPPRVNVPRLLEIRESRECRAFRDWLLEVDKASDAEIRDMLRSVRAKVASFYYGRTGSALKVMVNIASEFSPVPGAGLALGALDSFLVQKLLPHKGPVAFINNLYPSIFRRKEG